MKSTDCVAIYGTNLKHRLII